MNNQTATVVAVWWDLVEDEPSPYLMSLLGDDEQRVAARLPEGGRPEYLAAHTMLRSVLETLGWPGDASLVRGACPLCGAGHGRPRLDVTGAPEFSLTHAGGVVSMAMSQCAVGIDAEVTVAPHVVDEVAPFLHPTECWEIQCALPAERPAAFTRAWVRTEAYLKGVGTGLGRDPSFDYLGPGQPALHPVGWQVQDIQMSPSHHCALAAEAPSIEIAVHRFGGPSVTNQQLRADPRIRSALSPNAITKQRWHGVTD